MYANNVKIQQFTAKDLEIKPYPLCLGNISKDFSVDVMIKIIRLNGMEYKLSVSQRLSVSVILKIFISI